MTQYYAFLRAVNVGGRVVKMDLIQSLFDSLGLTDVATFLASGNVRFRTARNRTGLEAAIEAKLESALGYEVVTIVRTHDELAAIAAHRPFPLEEIEAPGHTLYVTLLKSELADKALRRLPSFETPTDALVFHGREIYRLSRGRVSESTLSEPAFARAMGVPGTARNMNTIRRLVAASTAGPTPKKPKRGGRG
jgi:uncharacterized protein (DUF1697 family)